MGKPERPVMVNSPEANSPPVPQVCVIKFFVSTTSVSWFTNPLWGSTSAPLMAITPDSPVLELAVISLKGVDWERGSMPKSPEALMVTFPPFPSPALALISLF